MNKKMIIAGVVALIVGAGVGYYGATVFAAPAKTAFTRGATSTTGFAARGGATTAGAGLLSGTVAAQDSGSITLDTRDGSSHVVLVTPDTTVSKSVAGSISDVSVGATVIVTGTTNSDGSVSASSIQLRSAGSFPAAPTTTGSTTN